MELSALHEAVRAVARGERPEAESVTRLSASEREAFDALRRRVRKAGGMERVVPPSDRAEWMAPPDLEAVR